MEQVVVSRALPNRATSSRRLTLNLWLWLGLRIEDVEALAVSAPRSEPYIAFGSAKFIPRAKLFDGTRYSRVTVLVHGSALALPGRHQGVFSRSAYLPTSEPRRVVVRSREARAGSWPRYSSDSACSTSSWQSVTIQRVGRAWPAGLARLGRLRRRLAFELVRLGGTASCAVADARATINRHTTGIYAGNIQKYSYYLGTINST